MPRELPELRLSAPVTLEAAAPGGESQPARIHVDAYGGGLMNVSGYGPVVIDLDGIEAGERVPLLADHENRLEAVLGSGQPLRADGRLAIDGTLARNNEKAQRVIDLHRDGVPLQASIGAEPLESERIPKGRQAVANGRTIRAETSSFLLVKRARLKHVAIVANGADHGTGIDIAAQAASSKERFPMEFTQWLEARDFDAAHLSEKQVASLRAMFDAEQAKANHVPAADIQSELNAIREQMAAESDRVRLIRAECGGRHAEIEAQAIRDGWDLDKVKLAVYRGSHRANAPVIPGGQSQDRFPAARMLEAALAINRQLPDIEDHYPAELLQAAEDRFGRRFKFKQALFLAAQANGYSGSPYIDAGTLKDAIRYAWGVVGIHASGSSTLSLPGILSNLANKELLAGFREQDQTWREIAVVKSVSDFKQVTSYRLLDDMEYEELAPDGEIKHGGVSEESYTRQARTYAKMFSLTRDKIIDDDLDAFQDLREGLGAGAARKLNSVFWTRFLNNAAFFTNGRGNFITGAGTALDINGTGLQAGILAFRKLKSADDKRIGGTPTILLVPPELQFIAQRLFQSTTVNTGGASANDTVPNDNIHAGKYRPIVSDWLSDTAFAGASAKAWYLFRNPGVLSPIVVSFLDGVQTPTVDSADADFNKLGIQLRGYFDFGVDFAEPLAGIKAKGEA